jgi:adenine C2-methylase RlmN of 23S rRNA A2503 and tRNA A37
VHQEKTRGEIRRKQSWKKLHESRKKNKNDVKRAASVTRATLKGSHKLGMTSSLCHEKGTLHDTTKLLTPKTNRETVLGRWPDFWGNDVSSS